MSNPGARRIVIATAILAAMASPAFAQLKDENLLAPLPRGFKVGYSASKPSEMLTEYVPQAESVDAWSRMVTVQIFRTLGKTDPEKFAGTLETGWKAGCPGGEAKKIKTGAENGYRFSLWVFSCPLNPTTNKPENMFLKATGGTDSLYSVQYAYRSELTKDEVIAAMAYLVSVGVCDTRLKDHPCPPGM